MKRGSVLEEVVAALLLSTCLLGCASAYPLCLNREAPFPSSVNLSFCSAPAYKAKGCCTPQADQQLEAQFKAYNISDQKCAAIVQEILCSQCDAFSADLHGVEVQQEREIPYLCSSVSAGESSANESTGYCSQVWNTCLNVSIQNSPFSPKLQGGSPSSPGFAPSAMELAASAGNTLGALWTSESDFCTGLGPSIAAGNFCFSGQPFKPPPAAPYTPPQGICLEKLATAVSINAYLNLAPHPDGSNRIFLANQGGTVYLATVPEPGSGKTLSINLTAPFLDLTDRVPVDNELGLMGLVFHPNFTNNGRFFVSYTCDKQKWADCAAQCACNSNTGCTPSQLGSGNLGGAAPSAPCRYSAVVAEYSANTTGTSPSMSLSANPTEVRRIFTMGLPYTTHHAGGLFFGPRDNYLYYATGDGGSSGDPFNFSQNKRSLLGKMLRFDVDNIPSSQEIQTLGLWGNYSVPQTNPFVNTKNVLSEIYAYGLRNPWRCSFDSERPTYFYCGDVGQEHYEEVDLITKGGNYGWRVYEGTSHFVPSLSPGGNTSANSIQPTWPIITYSHAINPQGSASITGGYVSYSRQDPCIYGKYVYGDLFGPLWAAAELPLYSGNYTTTKLSYQCAPSSPLNCSVPVNSTTPNLEVTLSFGVDNNHDLYILGGNGIYRVISPSNCGITCAAKLPPSALSPSSSPSPSPAITVPSPSPSTHGSGAPHSGVLQAGALYLVLATCVLIWL